PPCRQMSRRSRLFDARCFGVTAQTFTPPNVVASTSTGYAAFILSMNEADSLVPVGGIHLSPETISARASGEMVWGTGIARLIWAVPSLSNVVKASVCAGARTANTPGRANTDASDRLVIVS